ncbi:unnamed protein product, partial [Rotaria sp. Silwood2]
KTLPNLSVFSITTGVARGYDNQVLLLIRRMPNLKNLILCLNVIRMRFIDGIHLEKEILSHLSQLTTFIFHIRTIMPLLYSYHHASVDDVQNTFSHWKYGQVNCHVDYFSDKAGQCHIYSVPFKIEYIYGVTNSFFGSSFHLVMDLRLFDVRPFEHVYFNWIARAFPLLKYLTIDNIIPQEHKAEIEPVNVNQSSIIYFPRLMTITLTNAHIDYVHQFLRNINSHVPCFSSLEINYKQLVIATNNFTSDLTRVNCVQLKKLLIGEEIVYPKQFYLYFPFL